MLFLEGGLVGLRNIARERLLQCVSQGWEFVGGSLVLLLPVVDNSVTPLSHLTPLSILSMLPRNSLLC